MSAAQRAADAVFEVAAASPGSDASAQAMEDRDVLMGLAGDMQGPLDEARLGDLCQRMVSITAAYPQLALTQAADVVGGVAGLAAGLAGLSTGGRRLPGRGGVHRAARLAGVHVRAREGGVGCGVQVVGAGMHLCPKQWRCCPL